MFRPRIPFLLSSLLLAVWISTVGHVDGQEVLSIHGSGTTNPSRCVWTVMNQMMAGAKPQVRMTYRAIGTSSGTVEFLNGINKTVGPANDFGMGEVPINETAYQQLQAEGIEMIHLPFMLGAVAFFHNIPNVPILNMTACLLAEVLQRKITKWDHPAIKAENPHLDLPDLPITVARRVDGSSSTNAISSYLADACPAEWDVDNTGNKITWVDGTLECDGSAGMANCVRGLSSDGSGAANPKLGILGYMDAGQGILEGLEQVALTNKDGNRVDLQLAAERDGVSNAAVGEIPQTADADFSKINLINRPGQYTWPIVQMSYIYVRKDLTAYMDNPNEQSLLQAFLLGMYDDLYTKPCVFQHKFHRPTPEVRAMAINAIKNMLVLDQAATPWNLETSTQRITGMDDFVISQKRHPRGELEPHDLGMALLVLTGVVIPAMEQQIFRLNRAEGLSTNGGHSDNDENETQIKAALAMASISFVFWIIFILFYGVRWFTKA